MKKRHPKTTKPGCVLHKAGESVPSGRALAVGVDIGTTTVSAAVVELDSGKQLEAYTIPHGASKETEDGFASEQDVSILLAKAEGLLDRIEKSHSNIVCIGITGQMHGIAYIDGDGKPVSNLMNWQDKRADRFLESGVSCRGEIKRVTGEDIASGYGMATHFYNRKERLVPGDAAGFCSIMDLFGMRLCGRKKPLCSASVAASFGFFDLKKGGFRYEKLALLGIEEEFLPEVTSRSVTVGKWRSIPVAVAIGDNQAAFLGAVREHSDSLLVNIGTGAQVSAISGPDLPGGTVELRPLVEGRYIASGSALCGGSAYALLERFFRAYAVGAGQKDEPQYDIMNKLARKAYENREEPLTVDTAFCGTRAEPDRLGRVEGIGAQNFTPSALILGVIKGVCSELYGLYRELGMEKKQIVASGGAVRKNEVWQRVLAETFGMPVVVSRIREEAATGAALFSALCVGRLRYADGFGSCIPCGK